MNRYVAHVYVIPEDDDDRQLADGFVLHNQLKARQIQVVQPAGGWGHVLETFRKEYIGALRRYPLGHVVMLIDFDEHYPERRAEFEAAVPDDLKPRVFVIGARGTPEELRTALGMSLEKIGLSLAENCYENTANLWDHEHLRHNDPDRQRLLQIVKPILFGP